MHAQVGIAAANFVCGFILVIGSYVMEGLPETRRVQSLLVHFFRCVPPFNLGAAATPPSSKSFGPCSRVSNEVVARMEMNANAQPALRAVPCVLPWT